MADALAARESRVTVIANPTRHTLMVCVSSPESLNFALDRPVDTISASWRVYSKAAFRYRHLF
jgi:hypothetical protein